MSKKSPNRIYAVIRKGVGTMRLVRSETFAGALRHVAKDEYSVGVAEQNQLVEGTRRGVVVEEAGAEPVAVTAAPAGLPAAPMAAGDPPGYLGASASADYQGATALNV